MQLRKILLALSAQYFIVQPLMAAPFAYVTNGNDNNVTPIDLATNTALDTIAVGAGPEGIAVSPDGRFAYVANSAADTVSIINLSTNMVVATPAVGAIPYGVATALNPNGQQFAYVTNSNAASVSVISVASNTVVDTITLTVSDLREIATTPDGTLAYVASSNTGTPGVFVINLITNAQIDFIAFTGGVTPEPTAVAINPSGTFAYVTDIANENVTPIVSPAMLKALPFL